ncbi:MAG: flagellar basal body P-ring formation protein FlgA, partial [Gammaproteobacteria bacterium]|nr:flagellar basal body P-ring formation protein FlgA [Gammaproteobacteria bacterium]
TSIEQAVGLVSRRPLPMDALLSPANVEQPRLVRRGQRVRIDAGNRAIAISATGLALRDGRLGETVPVRNPRSERVIDAVVSDHGTVRIVIPGASGH